MVIPLKLASIKPGQFCKFKKRIYMTLSNQARPDLLNCYHFCFCFLWDILNLWMITLILLKNLLRLHWFNLWMIISCSFILLKDLSWHYWYMWMI